MPIFLVKKITKLLEEKKLCQETNFRFFLRLLRDENGVGGSSPVRSFVRGGRVGDNVKASPVEQPQNYNQGHGKMNMSGSRSLFELRISPAQTDRHHLSLF